MISKISNSEIGSIHWYNNLITQRNNVKDILSRDLHSTIRNIWNDKFNEIEEELSTYKRDNVLESKDTSERDSLIEKSKNILLALTSLEAKCYEDLTSKWMLYEMWIKDLSDVVTKLNEHMVKNKETPKVSITEEERIKFLKLALSLQGIIINTQIADEVLQTVDKIAELGGEFNLYDSAKISAAIRNKYKEEPKK